MPHKSKCILRNHPIKCGLIVGLWIEDINFPPKWMNFETKPSLLYTGSNQSCTGSSRSWTGSNQLCSESSCFRGGSGHRRGGMKYIYGVCS